MENSEARIKILSKMNIEEKEERQAGTWLERDYFPIRGNVPENIGTYKAKIVVAINVTDEEEIKGQKKKQIFYKVLAGHETRVNAGSKKSYDFEAGELVGGFDEKCHPDHFEKLVQKARKHFEQIWKDEFESFLEVDFAINQIVKESDKAIETIKGKVEKLQERQSELEIFLDGGSVK